MNYLPGPITRNKLADLNRLVGADVRMLAAASAGDGASVTAAEITGRAENDLPGRSTQPVLGSKVPVYFLPVKLSLSEAHRQAADRGIAPTEQPPRYHYRPTLLGQAQIWFANRTYNVNTQEKVAVVLSELNQRGLVQWQDYATEPFAAQDFDYQALPPNATFADLVYPFDDEKNVTSLASDFADWLTRSYHLTLYRNPDLKLVSEVGESKEDFLDRIQGAGSSELESKIEAIQTKYAKQRKTIEDRKLRKELELEKEQTILNQRRIEEAGGAGLQTVLGLPGWKEKEHQQLPDQTPHDLYRESQFERIGSHDREVQQRTG